MRPSIPPIESTPADDEPSSSVRPRAPQRQTSRGAIVGASPKLVQALRLIDRVAQSHCTVLITGESGTGKESIAAALHDGSTRREAPFVAINCGGIPTELAEAELFGHARGAFTGAWTQRKGLVSTADGGTLFLDEVGELPLAIQAKLLRLLQEREFNPVGDPRSCHADIRVVAATNRDLAADLRDGHFREDLYYRLNVVCLRLPPLRERGDDVVLLAHHFFGRMREEAGRTDLMGFSPQAMQAMVRCSWPGNVRSLANAVERAVWTATGPWIDPAELFPEGSPCEALGPIGATLEDASARLLREPDIHFGGDERPSDRPRRKSSKFPAILPEAGLDMQLATERYQNHLIEQALRRTGGNKNRAAALLGVNRTTLSEMIRRRGLRTE